MRRLLRLGSRERLEGEEGTFYFMMVLPFSSFPAADALLLLNKECGAFLQKFHV
jgi:hypothetical protein